MEMITQLVKVFFVYLFTEYSKYIQDQPDLGKANVLNSNGSKISDLPYFASLQGCGAAILSDSWIVTAAHCVYDLKLNPDKRLWIGGESISKSQQINFDKIIIHPEFAYFYKLPLNDIAVLHLTEPLKFTDKRKPIRLRIFIENRHSKHILVGKQKNDSSIKSQAIQSLELIRLTAWECIKYIPKDYKKLINLPNLSMFDSTNICTKSWNEDKGMCLDEYGSLLVNNHQLVGLLLYGGKRDCKNNRIMLFTNVPAYTQWVKSVT